MNIGVGLGILAFIQLVIAWFSDQSVERLDKPLFTKSVTENPGLGIKGFFAGSALATDNPSGNPPVSEKLGAGRVDEVLRFARLSSSARQTFTALAVSLASIVGSIILVAIAHPKANLKLLRIGGAALIAGLVLITLILLVIKIASSGLSADLHAPGEMRAGGASRKRFLARYLARLHDGRFLSRYRSAAFIGAVVAILIVIGI